MYLMYEEPDTKFEGLAMRFMDIRKRVYELPTLGRKAMMVRHSPFDCNCH
jgi:acetaldehyde dehydrogenase/alcohol dehydrogenase